MLGLVVGVHERSLHLLLPLDLQLQRLADVVRLAKRRRVGKNDVDLHVYDCVHRDKDHTRTSTIDTSVDTESSHLDEKVAAEVKCANRVDHEDLGVVIERQKRDLLQEVWVSRVTCQVLYMF